MTPSRPNPALLALSLLALALAGYLLILWRREPRPLQPIGVLFVGNFMRALVDFVIEEVAVRPT